MEDSASECPRVLRYLDSSGCKGWNERNLTLASVLLLLTTLLLLLCFLVLRAGDSCSGADVGDGGELGCGQAAAAAKRLGWKKAAAAGLECCSPSPEAAISWLAIRSWDGVNIAELGNVGKATDVSGAFSGSPGSTFMLPSRRDADKMSATESNVVFT